MKILIVEDNVSSKLLLQRILKREGYDLVLAGNGEEALNILKKEKIDAVLTDWMMPKLNGLELVKRIRGEVDPVPAIIVITALGSSEAKEKALDAGADDYITKPIDRNDVILRVQKCLSVRKSEPVHKDKSVSAYPKLKIPFVAVCIATSTGGPPTLVKIFDKIRDTKKAAFFIVQHGPLWMLHSLAERLNKSTSLPVKVAEESEKIEPGAIFIAPGDRHMVINPNGAKINLIDTPPENYVRPSADPIFRSTAKIFGSNCIAVILTGMGHDGTIGAGYISAVGGLVIAQEPATAILSSMPQSVVNLRIAQIVEPLKMLSSVINENVIKLSDRLMK